MPPRKNPCRRADWPDSTSSACRGTRGRRDPPRPSDRTRIPCRRILAAGPGRPDPATRSRSATACASWLILVDDRLDEERVRVVGTEREELAVREPCFPGLAEAHQTP